MYAATFTFAKRDFDERFHALDAVIAQVARSTPGYLGEECWEHPTNGLGPADALGGHAPVSHRLQG
jgi:hypothetical protein